MGVLNDVEIERLCVERGMVHPFARGERREGEISYGLSAYGYDFRVAGEFEVFQEHEPLRSDPPLDPKNFKPGLTEHLSLDQGQPLLLPPYSFALGVSYERFDIPRDIITLCLNKSTYARCGLYVNITPFEPEWRGHATVELTNPTPRAVKIYPFEGIAQLLFLQAGLNHEEFAEMIRQATLDTDITTFGEGMWPGGYYPDTGRLICRQSYADKGGKYQDQEGRIVHPKVDGEAQ